MAADRTTLTRRTLLRGLGTAAVVAGCTQEGGTTTPDTPGGTSKQATRLSFVLDGEKVERNVEPRTTLLELLRTDLDKTGVKSVCERGACGACMVLVDGVPRNSCMLLAHDAEGREVVTVHGLESDSAGRSLQAAFVEADALQCGFCTPGMLISCTGLLKRRTNPNEAEIREAIAGNLCRCGTYPHVVAAVTRVAGRGSAGT